MQFGNKQCYLDTPQIMGVLNVTPDSFSDGGQHNSIDDAVKFTAESTFVEYGNVKKTMIKSGDGKTTPNIVIIRLFTGDNVLGVY